jgi:hypothetical protein
LNQQIVVFKKRGGFDLVCTTLLQHGYKWYSALCRSYCMTLCTTSATLWTLPLLVVSLITFSKLWTLCQFLSFH